MNIRPDTALGIVADERSLLLDDGRDMRNNRIGYRAQNVSCSAGSDLFHPMGALVVGVVVYGLVGAIAGLRLSQEEEYNGADLSIHKIASTSDD